VPSDHEALTLAELVASLALATDLAMGHPLEQGLGTCLVSTRMAELAGLTAAEVKQTFYVALLRHIGCTTENQALANLADPDRQRNLPAADAKGHAFPVPPFVDRGEGGHHVGFQPEPDGESAAHLADRPVHGGEPGHADSDTPRRSRLIQR